MRCPRLKDLPKPATFKRGWPWTDESTQLPELLPDGCNWPRISITTPSFNQGRFLEETIRSVLLQGYPDLEYIIIDGGSEDESVSIIKKYESWLKHWVSEPDKGQSHAINKGWNQSSGELLAYLNSDDTYLRGALEVIAQKFRANTSVAAVVGDVVTIDEESKNLNGRNCPLLSVETPSDLTLLDPELWRLPQQSGFFNKAYMDKVGCFVRETLHYTMDRELYYRLAGAGRVVVVESQIATFRRHSLSKSVSEIEKMYREDRKAVSFVNGGGLFKRIKRWYVCRWWFAKGQFKLAKLGELSRKDRFKHLCWSLAYRPSLFLKRKMWVEMLKVAGMFDTINRLRRAIKRKSKLSP